MTAQFGRGATWNVRVRAIAGIACITLYCLPLFVPPGAVALLPPAADATLLERLFPDVPGWWVIVRLLALAVGALLLARELPLARVTVPISTTRQSATASTAMSIALAVAGLHALGSFGVRYLGRWEQATYLALLFAPAAIVWLASRQAEDTATERTNRDRAVWQVALLLLVWIVWALWSTRGNPMAATPVDTWQNVRTLATAIEEERNLLLSADQPTMNDLHILLLGADLFHRGRPPSLWELQAAGIMWVAFAAAMTAWGIGLLVSWRAAPLAAAMVLFSPITLGLIHFPYPFVMQMAGPALLLALVAQLYVRRSPSAFLCIAPAAGLTLTQGYVAVYAAPVVLAAVWLATRPPRLPRALFLTAALSFCATTIPALLAVDIGSFTKEVTGSLWPWWAVETYLFDQRWLEMNTIETLERSGRNGPFDIAISGLLAPFAIPRTALRLWGDSVLEPLAAALTLIGLLLCLRRSPQRRFLVWWVVAWLFAQLPVALTTSYDRITPLRNLAIPVASAPFAALALVAIWQASGAAIRRAAAAAPVLIALSGLTLFVLINPRILSTGAMQIILEATGTDHDSEVAILEIPGLDHPRIREMATYFRTTPLPVATFQDRQSLTKAGAPTQPLASVFFWSPGLEEECRVSQAICALWPETVIYTIHSRSRLSRAFAASQVGSTSWWPDSISKDRWQAEPCASFQSPFPGELKNRFCTPGPASALRPVTP